MNLGDRDYDLIARTILGEAANEPFAGKAGVANVILNRLKAGNYGGSVPEVLFAPKQFEPWNTRRSELMAYGPQTKGWDEALTIAKTVGRGLAPDPTGGALNFLNRDYSAKRGDSAMRPGGWGNNMENPIQIGGHTFGTAAGAGTGREGRVRVASTDPSFAPSRPTPPAQTTGETMTPRSYGSLGGLGGMPEPTGMQTLGNTLQAIGMSLLSSPGHSPFQALPEAMQVMAKNKAAQSLQQYNMQKDERDFGLRKEDLEARRAEQAIDNARQDRALGLQERNAEVSGLGEMARMTMARFGITPKDPTWMEKYKIVVDEMRQTNPAKTSLTPTWGTNDKGETVAVVPTDQGGVQELKLPPGFKREAGIDKIDAGTHWIIRDKASGAETIQQKNVGEVKSLEIQGKLSGEAIAAAPKNIARITSAIDLLDKIQGDPIREYATGLGHLVPGIIPNKISDFHTKVEQAKAGAFTEGLEALRGFGPVTEREGEAARAAVTRMKTAMTDEGFNEALTDYKKHLQAGLEKAQALLQGRADPAPMTSRPSGGGGRMRFDASGNPM
jgi:hypothetical protein